LLVFSQTYQKVDTTLGGDPGNLTAEASQHQSAIVVEEQKECLYPASKVITT